MVVLDTVMVVETIDHDPEGFRERTGTVSGDLDQIVLIAGDEVGLRHKP